MKKPICLPILALVLMSAQSFGSDLTLFGGLQRQEKITLKSAANAAVNQTFDPRNFGVMGLRLGIGKKVFGSESTFAYSPNFIDSSAKALILNTNLLLQVPTDAAKPYVTAGVGTIFTMGSKACSTCSGLSDIGTKFAVNYGGGIKVTVKGPVGVRFDVRGYTIPKVQDQTLNALEATFGLVFIIGK